MSRLGATKPVWRLGDGQAPRLVDDLLAEERAFALIIGGQEAACLMASPLALAELAAGYCLTMGWARPGDAAPAVGVDEPAGRVVVDLAVERPPTTGARASGGGPLGPPDAAPLPAGPCLELDVALALTGRMAQAQEMFRATGATHAAALFDAHGQMLAAGEDVGRHNALDKAVGAAWLAGRLDQAVAAALSGRISLEMALKAARAGVRLLVSVSAPTAAAVEAAQRVGLTVLGFSRAGRVNVYTHSRRVGVHGQPLA